MRFLFPISLSLLTLFSTSCGSMKVRGDVVTKETYTQDAINGAGKMSARAKISGGPLEMNKIVLAPIMLTYEYRDKANTSQYSYVEAIWDPKNQSSDFITLANYIYNTIYNLLNEGNYGTVLAKDAFSSPDLAGIGRYPNGDIGKGYTVPSFQGKQYDPMNTAAILAANPGSDTVLYMQVRLHLYPHNLVDVNSVLSMNYHAYQQYKFQLCKIDQCTTVEVPMLRTEVLADVDHNVPIVRNDDYKNPKAAEQVDFSNEVIARAIAVSLANNWDKISK